MSGKRRPAGRASKRSPSYSARETSFCRAFYPEFEPYEGLCRFDGCCHLSEPGCAVKDAAQRGEIAPERLERYAALFAEVKEKWDRRYS